MLKYYSYGKINLFLDIISTYEDGYHEIRSIFSEISLYDLIEHTPNQVGKFRYFDRNGLLSEDNLFKRAGDLFSKHIRYFNNGIDFYLKKNIPIGGGLGGGSSNAAAVLKILNKNYKTHYSKQKLKKIGRILGADVPFFIEGSLQLVNGIGEKTRKINIKFLDLNILLVFPKIAVMTKHAYKLIDEFGLNKESKFYKNKYINLIDALKCNDYLEIINNVYNTFEEVIYHEYPDLKKIYTEILESGADKVLLSGSGSTIIGFYSTKDKLMLGFDRLIKNGQNTVITELIL